MEKLLPAEMLMKIFLNLTIEDMISVSETCTYWQDIIENFNCWKTQWNRLLNIGDRWFVKCYIHSLKELNTNSLKDFKTSCIRFKNIFLNKEERIKHCFNGNESKFCKFGVLKTHHSHITVKIHRHSDNILGDGLYYIRRCDNTPDSEYNTENMFTSIENAFTNHLGKHIHIGCLLYCYPLDLKSNIINHLIKCFFETLHIDKLIFVPRVIVVCENLHLLNAVVVISTSKSTEIVVIVNDEVVEDRWTVLPIGGWRVSQQLHNTYMWLNPDSADTPVELFEDSNIKEKCWLNVSAEATAGRKNIKCDAQPIRLKCRQEKIFFMEKEQYLAPEIMYSELNLPYVIKKLLNGLPDTTISNCLNHVILTGGNSKLKYFSIRLKLDLVKIFPKYSHIITVSSHCGNKLSYTPQQELIELEKSQNFKLGKISYISRDQYITVDY